MHETPATISTRNNAEPTPLTTDERLERMERAHHVERWTVASVLVVMLVMSIGALNLITYGPPAEVPRCTVLEGPAEAHDLEPVAMSCVGYDDAGNFLGPCLMTSWHPGPDPTTDEGIVTIHTHGDLMPPLLTGVGESGR